MTDCGDAHAGDDGEVATDAEHHEGDDGDVCDVLLVPGRVGRRGRGGGIGDCGDAHAGGGEDNGKAVGGGER